MVVEGLKAKPVLGIVAKDFLVLGCGQSTSTSAEAGVPVVFATPFSTVPIVVIAQHQEKTSWIDPASITTTGFTWYGEEDVSGIDWIAVGT